MPLSGALRFFAECALWLALVAAAAGPLALERVRTRLAAAIPR
jgi:hypothetical protein